MLAASVAPTSVRRLRSGRKIRRSVISALLARRERLASPRARGSNAEQQHEHGGRGAGQEHPAPARVADAQIEEGGHEEANREGHLHDLQRFGPQALGPRFGDQRRAGRPFAADADAGDGLQDR